MKNRVWSIGLVRIAPRTAVAGASRAVCHLIVRRARVNVAKLMTIARIASTWGRNSDEREEGFRRWRRPRQVVGQSAEQGWSAPADVPSPQSLQVLFGQDRRHQLQG